MVIFGAVDFTSALARAAKLLGYRVSVCDARTVFATARRFPMADDIMVAWPDEVFARYGTQLGARDAVCILTHDPKFDVPAIQGALATNVGYIGVMGSRKTHAKRMERLADIGLQANDLVRVMSPIGLDIGARTPEETAISICGEIIARRTGRGNPIKQAHGPFGLAPGPDAKRQFHQDHHTHQERQGHGAGHFSLNSTNFSLRCQLLELAAPPPRPISMALCR